MLNCTHYYSVVLSRKHCPRKRLPRLPEAFFVLYGKPSLKRLSNIQYVPEQRSTMKLLQNKEEKSEGAPESALRSK